MFGFDFSFIPTTKIHFVYIFDTLNFVLQCYTVTLTTEMQVLWGEITLTEFKTGY